MARNTAHNREIGARIAAERERRMWDHADLAVKIGCAPEQVRRMERGSFMSDRLIDNMAEVFGIRREALLARAD